MFRNFPDMFKDKILGARWTIEKFWADMQHRPNYEDIPTKGDASWQSRTIPLTLHGDGTPHHWSWEVAVEVDEHIQHDVCIGDWDNT